MPRLACSQYSQRHSPVGSSDVATCYSYSYLHANELVLRMLLRQRQVKLGQSERGADLIADMRVKEESHSAGAEVTITVDLSRRRVDLRVSPEVANSLYINNDQLVTRTLK